MYIFTLLALPSLLHSSTYEAVSESCLQHDFDKLEDHLFRDHTNRPCSTFQAVFGIH